MSETLEGIRLADLRKRVADGLDLKAILGDTPALVFRPPDEAVESFLFQTPAEGNAIAVEEELGGATNVLQRGDLNKVVYAHPDAVVVPLTPTNRNLVEDQVLVGRGRANDVRLTSREVSKSHCAFSKSEGDWFLTDLSSSNGTSVNGTRLEADRPYRLRSSDELEIAELAAMFVDPSGLLALTTMLEGGD
jgi:pSer/pThr/pTyr-binding forkhead associated (FHA) protein